VWWDCVAWPECVSCPCETRKPFSKEPKGIAYMNIIRTFWNVQVIERLTKPEVCQEYSIIRLTIRIVLNGTVPFFHISQPSRRFNKNVNFVPFLIKTINKEYKLAILAPGLS
jgi:hypothetical protein